MVIIIFPCIWVTIRSIGVNKKRVHVGVAVSATSPILNTTEVWYSTKIELLSFDTSGISPNDAVANRTLTIMQTTSFQASAVANDCIIPNINLTSSATESTYSSAVVTAVVIIYKIVVNIKLM